MYSAQDLSDITGVSVRTIEYYVHKGVLSRPLPRKGREGPDRGKGYTRKHLAELRETLKILDRNMTLDDIRDYLHPPEEDDDE